MKLTLPAGTDAVYGVVETRDAVDFPQSTHQTSWKRGHPYRRQAGGSLGNTLSVRSSRENQAFVQKLRRGSVFGLRRGSCRAEGQGVKREKTGARERLCLVSLKVENNGRQARGGTETHPVTTSIPTR